MDFLEKLKQLNSIIEEAKDEESEVDRELSNNDDWDDRKLDKISGQENTVIEDIEHIEEEFLSLIGYNSGYIIDKAEEVLELEYLTLEECKEIAPSLSKLAGDIRAAGSSGDHPDAEANAVKRIGKIKNRLRALEQKKKQILSDLGDDERDAIEFLISTEKVEEEVIWLEKLVKNLEGEENNFESLAKSIHDEKQVKNIEDRQKEIQKIEEGLKQLKGRSKDLEKLRKRQESLSNEAEEVKKEFLEDSRELFTAESNAKNLSPTLKEELKGLKPVIQRLSESSEALAEESDGMFSRREMLRGFAKGIAFIGVGTYAAEREASEEIEEIRKDHQENLEQSNDIRGEKQSGNIVAQYISSRSEGERSMRVDFKNQSNNLMTLEVEYIIPKDLELVDANTRVKHGKVKAEEDHNCLIKLEIPPGKQRYTQIEMKLLKGKPEKVEIVLKPSTAQNPDQIAIPINNT